MTEPPALLSVEGVSVDLPTPRGNLRAVDQVDLTIGAGRTLGIVGESGCGKTMLSRAILQLLPKKAQLSGRVMFDGQDLVRLDPERLRKLRGRSLAVVFQDPMTSLNPVLTIGTQLIETLQEHLELDGATAKRRSVELLAAVGHSRAGATIDAISASAFRRHAAAGGDRDCAVVRTETLDRR